MNHAPQVLASARQGVGDCLLAAGAHPLVHLNAALNLLATVLLLAALWQIKRGRESAHGRTMLAALIASTAFLVSYLTYHFAVKLTTPFTHPGVVKYAYYAILLSHVVLAMAVPVLALWAAWLGIKALGWSHYGGLAADDRSRHRAKHRRLVRWAFPIWLYVSVSGVVVYAMLYHLWPSAAL